MTDDTYIMDNFAAECNFDSDCALTEYCSPTTYSIDDRQYAYSFCLNLNGICTDPDFEGKQAQEYKGIKLVIDCSPYLGTLPVEESESEEVVDVSGTVE